MDDFEAIVDSIHASRTEKLKRMGKLPEDEILNEMRADVAKRLGGIIDAALLHECERLGRSADLDRVLDDETADPQAFFASAIPNYPNFMRTVLEGAIKRLA